MRIVLGINDNGFDINAYSIAWDKTEYNKRDGILFEA